MRKRKPRIRNERRKARKAEAKKKKEEEDAAKDDDESKDKLCNAGSTDMCCRVRLDRSHFTVLLLSSLLIPSMKSIGGLPADACMTQLSQL